MIVSHRHRFIFLKTMKTAGTSVELALSDSCGDDDIITPVTAADEVLRGRRGPQHYLGDPALARPIRPDGRSEAIRDCGDCYNHMTAREVRDRVGARIWRDYFKWTIERNPWDRQVSWYYFTQRGLDRIAFDQHLQLSEARLSNFDIYAIDDRVAVDFVCRFETLTADLTTALAAVGLVPPARWPRAKSTFRPAGDDYRRHYTAESTAQVAGWYAREIAQFDYQF